MDEEEAVDSVHGKLMQGCDGNDVTDDVSPNHTNNVAGKKSPSALDFKVDIAISKSTGSVADRRRQAVRARKRCLLLSVILLGITVAIVVTTAVILLQRTDHTRLRVIRTSIGTVHGRVVEAPQGGVLVAEYLGLPFALPPLNELRYADPVPVDRLPSDPYDATDLRNSCMQPIDKSFNGDFAGTDMWNAKNPLNEDCLYLNVWSPVVTDDHRVKQPLKAVMVWIYGGGFYSGTNALWTYDGKTLASFADVVVVSFNYRVGTFGYLSTGDGRIKGNFGMKDQVMALRWIRDHITSFGGDPARVTLFGESSGASSAGLHQMSSWSKDLFLRAIYQSGSPDSQWSFMTRAMARRRSAAFFDAVGCSPYAAVTDDLLACLRRLEPQTILDNEWVQSDFMVFPWAPTVDGDFLIDTPYNMLTGGLFQRKEALLGVNRDEGTFWILFVLPGFSKDTSSRQNLTMFQNGVDIIGWDLNTEQRQRIRDRYLVGDGSDEDANRDALDKVCGDRSFTCPTKELTETFSGRGLRTYFYYLTHRSSTEIWPPWMGVIHGADIQWVFGMPLNKSRGYTDEEVEFSKTIMTYWTNFAKTGDPNDSELPNWPEFKSTGAQYLEMRGPKNFVVTQSFRDEYCHVWRDVDRQIQMDSSLADDQESV